VTKEKVHGDVELGIDPDHSNHAQVPQHGDCVDGQENQEQGHLEVWIFWEAHKDEGDSSSLILFDPMDKIEMLT
jgi:hypothetical protein